MFGKRQNNRASLPLWAWLLSLSIHGLVGISILACHFFPFDLLNIFFSKGTSTKPYKSVKVRLANEAALNIEMQSDGEQKITDKQLQELIALAMEPLDPDKASDQYNAAAANNINGHSISSNARPDDQNRDCNNLPPRYPDIAREMGYEGLVLLDVSVSELGFANAVEVYQSSNYDVLDKAAIEAVRLWQFIPAMKEGKPVAQSIRIPIRFKLTK